MQNQKRFLPRSAHSNQLASFTHHTGITKNLLRFALAIMLALSMMPMTTSMAFAADAEQSGIEVTDAGAGAPGGGEADSGDLADSPASTEADASNSDIQPIEPAVPELITLLDNEESDELQPEEINQEAVETLANRTVTINLSKISFAKGTQTGTGWSTYMSQSGDVTTLRITGSAYDYVLTGTAKWFNVEILASPVKVVLKNATVNHPLYVPGLVVKGNATIDLQGKNTITGGTHFNSIQVPSSANLTIGSNSGGTLVAGNQPYDSHMRKYDWPAEIKVDGNLTIQSGAITANGTKDKYGIANNGIDGVGSLVINGGNLTASGIIGLSNFTINNGSVKSVGNQESLADRTSVSVKKLTVNGGTLTGSASYGYYGGINAETFTVTGGTIKSGAACALQGKTINISGGTIVADGLYSHRMGSSVGISATDLSISGGNVTAIAIMYGISATTLNIASAANVTALQVDLGITIPSQGKPAAINPTASTISGTARLLSGKFDASFNTSKASVVSVHNASTLAPVKSISIPASTSSIVVPANTSFATTVPSGSYTSYFYSDTQSGSLLKVSDSSATLSSTTSTTPTPVKLGTDSFLARHAGAGRYDTASSIAQTLSALGGGASTKTVIIASGENYPDALAASGLSGIHGGAPVVLTNPTTLSAQAKSAINAAGAENAIIVGSSKAVSNPVLSAINALPSVKNTTRLAGTNRQGTAEAIYNSSKDWSHTAIITTDANYADALSIAPYAAASKSPIFLTLNKTSLTNQTLAAIKAGNFERIIAVGSSAAVSDAAFTSACNAAGIDPKNSTSAIRLSGTDRYKTCMAIVNWITDPARQTEDSKYSSNTRLSWTYPAVTTGENYPDALAGGALQGRLKSVILLSQPNQDQGAGALLTLHHKEVLNLRVFGSAASVSTPVTAAYASAARDNS